MKKIIIWLLAVGVAVGAGLYISKSYQSAKQSDRDEVSTYFYNRMVELAIADIGMAIEGFDPQLLMMAYPGLKSEDFQGVEAFEGRYEVNGEEISFVRDQSQPITSAERTVSEEGYQTLLTNLSSRLSVSRATTEDIDNLIEIINTAERVRTRIDEGASAFGFKVIPTELLEDSRCAIDVQCIQAGTVRVRASFESPTGQGSKIFVLDKPEIVGNWEVILVQVEPAPESTREIGESDYIFYFRISTRVN